MPIYCSTILIDLINQNTYINTLSISNHNQNNINSISPFSYPIYPVCLNLNFPELSLMELLSWYRAFSLRFWPWTRKSTSLCRPLWLSIRCRSFLFSGKMCLFITKWPSSGRPDLIYYRSKIAWRLFQRTFQPLPSKNCRYHWNS